MLKVLIVGLLSFLPSVGGLFYAVYISGSKDDAQRGGAIGTALALCFVFISRSYGMKLFILAQTLITKHSTQPGFDQTEQRSYPLLSPEETSDSVQRLAAAIVMDGKEQKILNICVAITTFFATVIWGFGDKFVEFYIKLHHR